MILAVNGYVLGIEANAWYIDIVHIQMIISFKNLYPNRIKKNIKIKIIINIVVMADIKYGDTRTTPYSQYIWKKNYWYHMWCFKTTFVWMCAQIFVLILYQQLMHVALASLSWNPHDCTFLAQLSLSRGNDHDWHMWNLGSQCGMCWAYTCHPWNVCTCEEIRIGNSASDGSGW